MRQIKVHYDIFDGIQIVESMVQIVETRFLSWKNSQKSITTTLHAIVFYKTRFPKLILRKRGLHRDDENNKKMRYASEFRQKNLPS